MIFILFFGAIFSAFVGIVIFPLMIYSKTLGVIAIGTFFLLVIIHTLYFSYKWSHPKPTKETK